MLITHVSSMSSGQNVYILVCFHLYLPDVEVINSLCYQQLFSEPEKKFIFPVEDRDGNR